MLDSRLVRRRFDRAAAGFDNADFVHAETRRGLFERLEGVTVDARTVVDLGSATGAAMPQLGKRFRRARVIAVDVSEQMLLRARRRKGWLSKFSFLCADAGRLPFVNGSIDVVYSNLLLPWVGDPAPLFAEVARVLRKDGVFAFATLGPDSLQELARAWAGIDSHAHVIRFADMHDIGDSLVRAGLREPVLDVDRLGIRYRSSSRLFADLTAAGARNCLRERPPGLVGRKRFLEMTNRLEPASKNQDLSLDLELVYGHCWGGGPRQTPGDWRIDADAIPVRRK